MKTGTQLNNARSGGRIRLEHTNARALAKDSYDCMNCNAKVLRRLRAGIWHCKTCNLTITGCAFTPI